MQIVIDIPKEQYCRIMQSHRRGVERFVSKEAMMYAIKTGTPLPKGHGRLGDLTELYNKIDKLNHGENKGKYTGVLASINFAPTIIEADKEE